MSELIPASAEHLILKRDSEVWFEDGNIILVCETKMFRVHRGILSLNSEVFRDMLSVGTVSNEHMIDGCPSVCLPDKAQDVQRYLSCIYQRDYFYPGKPVEYEVLESLLRLSTKYLTESIRNHVIEHLRAIYPSTLEEFLASSTKNWPWFRRSPHHSILAVNIARECNVPIILPAALYYCCENSVAKIMDGIPDHEGRLIQLSPTEQRICLSARNSLIKDKIHVANRYLFLQGPSLKCAQRKTCQAALREAMTAVLCCVADCDLFTSPLPTMWYADGGDHGCPVCEICKAEWDKQETAGYKEAWNRLPSRFGLPSWNELATATH